MPATFCKFGVMWPQAFQSALAVLSVVSLDIGVLTSMLCLVSECIRISCL
jgi:hypothetical protein